LSEAGAYRIDGGEALTAQHLWREFNVKSFLERKHDADRGKRRQASVLEISGVGNFLNWRMKLTILSKKTANCVDHIIIILHGLNGQQKLA